MKRKVLITCICFWCGIISAQQVTYNQHIAFIIKNHCLSCHHQNGVAPFSLETYEQTCKSSKLIEYVVTNRTMPPWSLDTSDHLFKSDRTLSSTDIEAIKSWINSAMPVGSGKPVKLKYVPAPKETAKPDLIVRLPKSFKIKGDNKDCFITYLKRLDLGEDKYLNKIEIMPGNNKLVHHCRVDFDTTDKMWTADVDKDGFIESSLLPEPETGPTIKFVGDYVPGINPYEYPKWSGLKIFRKVTIMINIHYSPSSMADYDQTEVHLYFCKKKPEREVFNYSHLIPHGPEMYVAKNAVDCFELKSDPFPYDISILAIQPHMHLLGKTMNICAITPANDTIDLCRVTKWNFNEQENYYYKKLVKIPAGSVFEVSACYDNTTNNTSNPSSPPQDVYFYGGMTTQNEMLEFYIQYLKYEEGDETKDVDDE